MTAIKVARKLRSQVQRAPFAAAIRRISRSDTTFSASDQLLVNTSRVCVGGTFWCSSTWTRTRANDSWLCSLRQPGKPGADFLYFRLARGVTAELRPAGVRNQVA